MWALVVAGIVQEDMALILWGIWIGVLGIATIVAMGRLEFGSWTWRK